MLQWALLGLEGFRVIGRRTYSFYVWTFLILIGFPTGIVLAGRLFDVLGLRVTPQIQGSPLVLVIMAPILAFASVLIGAVYRSVLEPEAARFAYLRLGWAEARLLPVALAVGLFLTLMALAAMAAGRWGIVVNVGGVAIVSRFTLIGPAVFRWGRLGLVEGWRLGRSRWRELLVMNLATWIIYAVGVTGSALAWRLYATAVFRSAPQDYALEPAKFSLGLTPGILIGAFVYTAIFVITVAPAAAAYRRLTEGDAAEAKAA